jgi:hypothetical protein
MALGRRFRCPDSGIRDWALAAAPKRTANPGTGQKSSFLFRFGQSRTLPEAWRAIQINLQKDEPRLGISAKRLAILMLPVALAACAGGDEGRSFSLFGDRNDTPQALPNNYRTELLAFMKTYLNNPVGVRDAALAEPVMRDVNGKMRYIACLRYSARESDGSYREPRDRAVLFVNGRLDRMIEKGGELCAGVALAAFPELEKMTR